MVKESYKLELIIVLNPAFISGDVMTLLLPRTSIPVTET